MRKKQKKMLLNSRRRLKYLAMTITLDHTAIKQILLNILSNAGINNVAATSASIDYRDVVLKLEIVPLINSDKEAV